MLEQQETWGRQRVASPKARDPYQRGHVPPMHLATGDLLLGLGHGAHLEVLRPTGTRPYDNREGHGAVLGFVQLVELLLQKG